ncbi:MAG: rhodanese-like domain-containing protein [Bdellovibrionia bacterium]
MKVFLSLILMFFSVSCQVVPTKTVETESPIPTLNQSVQGWLERGAIILDTRTPFDYNLAHIPGAVNIQWQEFSDKTPSKRGYLDKDTFQIARRLSLIGISPESEVLVVGYGPNKGNGEEGRIGWMLHNLGVKKVMTLKDGEIRVQNPRVAPSPKNAPMWIPKDKVQGELDQNLFEIVSGHKEAQVKIQTKARAKALQMSREFGANLRLEGLYNLTLLELQKDSVLIDVREKFKIEQEPLSLYLSGAKKPQVISWRDFYAVNGKVNPVLTAKLAEKSLSNDSLIVVFGDYGLESAAAVFALRELGYKRVLHYAGGVEELRGLKK